MRAREFNQIGQEAVRIVSWDEEGLKKLALSSDQLDQVLEAFVMFLQEAVATIRDFPEHIQPLLSDLYEEKLAKMAEAHSYLWTDPANAKDCERRCRDVSKFHDMRLSRAGLTVGEIEKSRLALTDLLVKATSSAVSLPRNVLFVKMAREQFIKMRKISGRPMGGGLAAKSLSGLTFLTARTAMTFALIVTSGLSQAEADTVRKHVAFFVGMVATLQEDLIVKLRNMFLGLALGMLDFVRSKVCLDEDVSKSLEVRTRDAYHQAWVKLDGRTKASLSEQEMDSLAGAYADLGGYVIDQAVTFTPLMLQVFAKASINQIDAEEKDAQTRN